MSKQQYILSKEYEGSPPRGTIVSLRTLAITGERGTDTKEFYVYEDENLRLHTFEKEFIEDSEFWIRFPEDIRIEIKYDPPILDPYKGYINGPIGKILFAEIDKRLRELREKSFSVFIPDIVSDKPVSPPLDVTKRLKQNASRNIKKLKEK